MKLTEEEIRLKAVEISFRSTDNMMQIAVAEKRDFKWDITTYFKWVDEICEYVETGTKPMPKEESCNQ